MFVQPRRFPPHLELLCLVVDDPVCPQSPEHRRFVRATARRHDVAAGQLGQLNRELARAPGCRGHQDRLPALDTPRLGQSCTRTGQQQSRGAQTIQSSH